jgi:hypothetical protein
MTTKEIMKKILYFIFGLTIICNSTNGQGHYRLIKPKPSSFAQIEDVSLQTECDSEFNVRYLKYWNNIANNMPQIIDSVDCSLYNSELLIYGSKKPTDYLILWVTEYEYTSDIHVFLITKNVLSKIGELPILSDCETCDDIIYPINRISVDSGRNEIIIKLLEPFKYDLGNNNLRKYQPNELFFKVDKLSRSLMTIDLQRRTETKK